MFTIQQLRIAIHAFKIYEGKLGFLYMRGGLVSTKCCHRYQKK